MIRNIVCHMGSAETMNSSSIKSPQILNGFIPKHFTALNIRATYYFGFLATSIFPTVSCYRRLWSSYGGANRNSIYYQLHAKVHGVSVNFILQYSPRGLLKSYYAYDLHQQDGEMTRLKTVCGECRLLPRRLRVYGADKMMISGAALIHILM